MFTSGISLVEWTGAGVRDQHLPTYQLCLFISSFVCPNKYAHTWNKHRHWCKIQQISSLWDIHALLSPENLPGSIQSKVRKYFFIKDQVVEILLSFVSRCDIYHISYFTAFQNCMKYSDPGARIWSCTTLWQLQSWAKYCIFYHGPRPPVHHPENPSRKRLFLAAMAAKPAGVHCPFSTWLYSPSTVLSPWGRMFLCRN